MRRAALLYNPRAGPRRDRRLEPIVSALGAGDWAVEARATEGPDHCRALARRAVEEGLDALFVLGGDGTLRVAAAVLAGSGVALGTLPGGTTNVVAGALGLPADPVAAARRLARAVPRRFDLGRAGDELFLMQLSGGLDARVMAAVDPRLKRRFGKGAVAWAGMREWLRYDFPRFELEIDDRRRTATGFVVANFAEYAGRFRIVPGARPDDRRLDLLLFQGRSRRAALGFALALASGRHAARADVERLAFDRARLVASQGAPLQVDGDPWRAPLPLEIALAESSVDLLVPEPAQARGGAAGGDAIGSPDRP